MPALLPFRILLASCAVLVLSVGSALGAQTTPGGSTLRAPDARAAAALARRTEGERLRDAGRGPEALAALDDALLAFRALGDRAGEAETLRAIGTVGLLAGRPRDAVAPLRAALAIFEALEDDVGRGRAWSNLGIAFADLGLSDSAIVAYRRSLVFRRAAGDAIGEATTLNNLGLVYSLVGAYDSAAVTMREALRIARRVSDGREEANALNSLGTLFQQSGQADSATAYYRQSTEAFRALGDLRSARTLLVNVANIHRERGNLAAAERALLDAEAAVTEAGVESDASAIGSIRLSLSAVQQLRGDLPRSETSARGALAIATTTGEARLMTAARSQLASLALAGGRPDSAIAEWRAAVALARQTGLVADESYALGAIGQTYHYYTNPRQPVVARAYYDSATAIRVQMLSRTESDDARLGRTEYFAEIYTMWAQAWLDSPTPGPTDRAYAALAVAERGRAQALLAMLRRASAVRETSDAAPSMAATGGASLPAEGRQLVQALGAQKTSMLVLVVLYDRIERYAVTPGGGGSIDFSYVSRDSLAALVAAARAGLGVDSAATRSVDGLDDLRGVRGVAPSGGGDAAFRALSRLLINSAMVSNLERTATRELLVVANGPLAMVPFAALPIDSAGTPLGTRFAIRYAPSLTTALALGARAATPRSGALVVGNPTMPSVPRPGAAPLPLTPLPAADAEAQWVAERLSAVPLRAGTATEAAVKRQLPDATVIHLATHGMAYSSAERARDSFVALASGNGEDGLLTVGEVLDEVPALHAELVVLSACQTGLGNLRQAEGTVGLQRAFLAKGARSVLVSLWSVSDEATDLLMRTFYQHWMGGASKPEALRRAQVAVRGAPGSRFHHPRYWAAFQLVGAP